MSFIAHGKEFGQQNEIKGLGNVLKVSRMLQLIGLYMHHNNKVK